jgi:hypothetical protein
MEENVITFKDFNFKLAVIQELKYNQKIISPKFDLWEFAKNYNERKIDIEKEGYEAIPEAINFF